MTDDRRDPLDVDALMEGIRARVAEKKARGMYGVDALALDGVGADAPWDQERLEALQAAAAVTQRIVVAPSDKPGLGTAVTKTKRFIVRAGWHNLEDVAGQITRFNAEIATYAASLGTEVSRLRREMDQVAHGAGLAGGLAERVARLEAVAADARLSRLEAGAPVEAPASAPDTVAASTVAPAAVEHLREAAVLDTAPEADLGALLGVRDRVLALRCGDGSMLDALTASDLAGVEERQGLADAAARAGRRVVAADPVAHLESLGAGSVDGVVAAGLLEELTPARLARLMRALGRAVAPDGAVVLEVRNPRCAAEMLDGFWRDPRRLRPIDPETVGVLLQVAGFPDTELVWGPVAVDAVGATVGSASRTCAVVARR